MHFVAWPYHSILPAFSEVGGLAPFAGGVLMTVSHDMQRIFLVAAIPAVLAGVASLLLWRHNAVQTTPT